LEFSNGGSLNMIRKILLTTAAAVIMVALSSVARADTVAIIGNETGSLATATVNCTFNSTTNTFTFTIQNTSPFDARITGVGFDLHPGDVSGNLNQASGLEDFSGVDVGNFTFRNDALGNVPQFNSAVLDFGFTTGNNGNFTNGNPPSGLAPTHSLTFTVSGDSFDGMSEEAICNAIFVRFQRVGPDGEGSDVGRAVPGNPVPEPVTMILFGTGLAGVAARARRRRNKE
jgi:hypothetical protein